MKRNALKIILLLFIMVVLGISAFCQKTDKLHLKNGDVITGEIMSMKLAMLTYKMDGPGTIYVKWEEVIAFRSDKIFEVTLSWGTITITRVDSNFYSRYHATLNDIVELIPIKDKIIRRLSGDFNLGFNYTKSSQVAQINVNTSVHYKIPKWDFGINFNSVVTSQESDTTVSKKQDATFTVLKDLDRKFYLGGNLGWQQNTELGLNNRFLLSGSIGLMAISDNHNRFLIATGISENMEQSIQSVKYTTNLDGLLNITYKRFYYSTPKLSIDAVVLIY
ncbi:MAG: hypothetical protein ACHQEM_11655, partial [Chitinophagales bacterium]